MPETRKTWSAPEVIEIDENGSLEGIAGFGGPATDGGESATS